MRGGIFSVKGGLTWNDEDATRTQWIGPIDGPSYRTTEVIDPGGVYHDWTAGAGLAYGFSSRFDVFGEYLHSDYGRLYLQFPLAERWSRSHDTMNSISFGLNIKL